jgi:ubiquitin carboxyl-terminal hydrolase 5/13
MFGDQDELEAFHKQKAGKGLEENDMRSSDEIVRPRVPLEACLANFASSEPIEDYYSSALKGMTTAIKTTGLTSFPDYLVLHMRKFVMEEGWVPKKLGLFLSETMILIMFPYCPCI